jgi:hypothetical protein
LWGSILISATLSSLQEAKEKGKISYITKRYPISIQALHRRRPTAKRILPLLNLGVSIFRRRARLEITLAVAVAAKLNGISGYAADRGPETAATTAEATAAVGGDDRCCGDVGTRNEAGDVACCYASGGKC